MLNQSVLLNGINHTADIQHALAKALFDAGVLPYYLHMLDRVQGAQHFEVSESAALELMRTLNATLPGYLVPRLVREVAHAPGKQPVVTQYGEYQ
jgi:L-lysine 2,3-aminomutase